MSRHEYRLKVVLPALLAVLSLLALRLAPAATGLSREDIETAG